MRFPPCSHEITHAITVRGARMRRALRGEQHLSAREAIAEAPVHAVEGSRQRFPLERTKDAARERTLIQHHVERAGERRLPAYLVAALLDQMRPQLAGPGTRARIAE